MENETSRGLERVQELKDKETSVSLTESQKKAYDFYVNRFKKAREEREKTREYFDDMSYEVDYVNNQRAVNSYLRKKINEDEVRVNTPTTENRVTGLINELMGLNLQPEVEAYDSEDNIINDLGKDFEAIVKRTNEMEQDDDKYVDIIKELLSQRAVFVEELFIDKYVRGKRVRKCEKRVLSGLQVYLGDINLPAWRFNEQPYIVKYNRVNYELAEQFFGKNENWKYVKPGGGDKYSAPFGFRMQSVSGNEVEILTYYSYPDNEYQVMINGVLMYEVGKSLPWGWEGYNITMVVTNPIAVDFAYGKSVVSSAKTLQALSNETIRNLIRKFRQALQPPLGSKSGRIYSRDIFNPGTITQGIKEGDLSKIIDTPGVTQGEMMMYNLIEQKTSEFIGASDLASKTKRMTAQETRELQKQAIKMLGLSVLATMRMKKNLTFLRIYNIVENHTKLYSKSYNELTKKVDNVYSRFTVNDVELGGEKKGRKIIQFTDREPTDEELARMYQYEEKMSMQVVLTRIRLINKKMIDAIKIVWYVSVVQKERDSSELSKAMFTDRISQALSISQITGRKLNSNKLIDSYERVWQAKDMFQKEAPGALPGQEQPMVPPVAGNPGQSMINSQVKQSFGEQPQNSNALNQIS